MTDGKVCFTYCGPGRCDCGATERAAALSELAELDADLIEVARMPRRQGAEGISVIEYLPIDVYAKDGTTIVVGKWVNGEWRTCEAAWSFFPGSYMENEPDCWWWNCDADWGGITDDEGPTHYFRLPVPPSEPSDV